MAPPRLGQDDACLESRGYNAAGECRFLPIKKPRFDTVSRWPITRAEGLGCETLGDAHLLSSPERNNLRTNRERALSAALAEAFRRGGIINHACTSGGPFSLGVSSAGG